MAAAGEDDDSTSADVEIAKVLVGDNGKPMARITWSWGEKVGIPDTYSNIGVPYVGATVYVEHDHEAIAAELEALAETTGKVVAKMRAHGIAAFQKRIPKAA